MLAQRAQECRGLRIGGEDGAPIPVAAERLGGKEAGGRDMAEGAHLAIAAAGAEALGRVRDDRKTMAGRGGIEAGVVRRQAEKVDGHDGTGIEPGLARGRDGPRHALDVDVAAVGLHVAEHRRGPQQQHRLHRGGEAEGRHDHRIPRPDPERPHGEVQGIGPIGAGNDMGNAAEFGERLLQLAHFGAHDELAMGQDASHPLFHRIAQPAALRL